MAGIDGVGSGGQLDLSKYLSALGKSASVDSQDAPAAASDHIRTAADSDLATVDRSTAVRRILADYDLHQITPREFSELTGRLHDAGVINDTDRANLSQLRRELDAGGVAPDESVDLFALLEDKLEELRRLAEDNESDGTATDEEIRLLTDQTTTALAQYDWLVKLNTIHQLGDGATVDQRA